VILFFHAHFLQTANTEHAMLWTFMQNEIIKFEKKTHLSSACYQIRGLSGKM